VAPKYKEFEGVGNPSLPHTNTKKTTRSPTSPQLLAQLPPTSCATTNFDFFTEPVKPQNDRKRVQNTSHAPKQSPQLDSPNSSSAKLSRNLRASYSTQNHLQICNISPRPANLTPLLKMQASEVDEYVKRQIQALKQASRARDNIWKRFREGFKGYTLDTFKLAHRITLRDLRDVLVSYRVPVDTPRRGLSCADALQACLQKELPKKQQSNQRSTANITKNLQPQASTQYSQPQPQYRVSPQPQYLIQPPFVQPQVQPQVQLQSQYQASYVQPQASQRSVQYDDDNNWSWPSNKQEQQEASESHEQPDFSYEVNDDDKDDSQSEGEDWDDDGYSDDYSDDDK
jgi:hypothetical protein